MSGAPSRLAFKLVAAAIAIPVGRAASKMTARAWAKARPEDPQHDPTRPDSGWRDTLIFAGITGIGATAAQLVTSKGADTAWRAITGKPSPPPKPPKASKGSKKAAKAELANTVPQTAVQHLD